MPSTFGLCLFRKNLSEICANAFLSSSPKAQRFNFFLKIFLINKLPKIQSPRFISDSWPIWKKNFALGPLSCVPESQENVAHVSLSHWVNEGCQGLVVHVPSGFVAKINIP
jgi:hypothetical protein